MKIQCKFLSKFLGKFFIQVFVLCTLSGHISAWAPTNFFRPDDPALHVVYIPKHKYLLGIHGEFGARKTGLDASGTRQNVLAIHDETQSVVSMLMNQVTAKDLPATIDPLETGGINLGGPALIVDRITPPVGRLKFKGKYEETDITFFGRYVLDSGFIPGAFSLSVFLPTKKKEIKSFSWENLTKDYMPGARELKDQIMKDKETFYANVKKYGDLSLQDAKNSGFGDLAISLEWAKDFKTESQPKNNKNKKIKKQKVNSAPGLGSSINAFTLWLKAGAIVPTGKERDENSAFSIALGNDGLWGFPFGAGLDMNFAGKIGAGVAFDVTLFADKTDNIRLKTNKNQTDFLLLNKGRATKDFGLTWDFATYLKVFQIVSHFDVRLAYQYVTHQDDQLFSQDARYKDEIINSATSLKGWYFHNLIFALEYDLERDKTRRKVVPEFSLFFKLPLGGESVIDMYTFGGQLSVSF
ncbi:MAG: hypothetical protein ABH827_02550 [bacterium]